MTLEDAKRGIQEAVCYVYDYGSRVKTCQKRATRKIVPISKKVNKEDRVRYRDIAIRILSTIKATRVQSRISFLSA
jgi:hypothetical protein